MLFPCQAVAFLALAMSGFTATVVILGSGRGFFVVVVCLFFMLQELILGKVPFFPSFLNALGNVSQQECSPEPLVAERRTGSGGSSGAQGTQGGRSC